MKEVNNDSHFASTFSDRCEDKSNIEALVRLYNSEIDEQVDSSLACGTHEKYQNYLISLIEN